ncbi:hypothetical protein Trydic_g11050 [Trypoxylus dichotomus]
MYIENVTELNEDVDQNMKLIQDSIENFNNNNKNLKKILIIISSPNIRAKRHANNIANGARAVIRFDCEVYYPVQIPAPFSIYPLFIPNIDFLRIPHLDEVLSMSSVS